MHILTEFNLWSFFIPSQLTTEPHVAATCAAKHVIGKYIYSSSANRKRIVKAMKTVQLCF